MARARVRSPKLGRTKTSTWGRLKHGLLWSAAIRRLSVGEHTIVGDTLFANGEHFVVPHRLTVVPRHDGNPEHGDDS